MHVARMFVTGWCFRGGLLTYELRQPLMLTNGYSSSTGNSYVLSSSTLITLMTLLIPFMLIIIITAYL